MANSSQDSTPQLSKKSKSTAKTKTTFRLAHPPPAVKHKQRLSIRPRLLLQLHHISAASRPIPIFDVLPPVVFAPRFARRFPRIFKGKDGLGADDLIVVKSQKYDALEDEPDHRIEDDHWDARELVAAICQTRNTTENIERKTEIFFNNGRSCEASSIRNGRYDLTFVDENGLQATARWVPRQKTRSKTQDRSVAEPEEVKHTFSLMNPNTRRHPVIATLSNHSIEINDRYSAPQPQTPPKSRSSSSETPPSPEEEDCDHAGESEITEQGAVEVDEHLRTLITVSGIWVAFQEGYSPYYSGARLSPPATPASKSPRTNRSRTINSAAAQSTGLNPQNHAQNPKITSDRSSWATADLGSSVPVTARPGICRAYTTSTSFLNRAKSRKSSVQAEDGLNGTWSPSEGKRSDREISQHSRREGRRNTVSLAEKSTNATPMTGLLRSATLGKGGTAQQLQALPEKGEEHRVKAGKIKRLFGLGR